uniref:Ig-like domain-containing protein n=1 Tax=Gadus morhua TaxID=8049 RepID=A0A8C5CE62_GADMO
LSRQFCGLILVLTLSLGNSPREDVISTEGLTVSLRCTFKTMSTNAYVFWYKQQVNDLPRFMLQRFTIGEGNNAFHKDRFGAKIQNTSVPLRIQNLQLSDSALYYCALRPTVTGNTDSLGKAHVPNGI